MAAAGLIEDEAAAAAAAAREALDEGFSGGATGGTRKRKRKRKKKLGRGKETEDLREEQPRGSVGPPVDEELWQEFDAMFGTMLKRARDADLVFEERGGISLASSSVSSCVMKMNKVRRKAREGDIEGLRATIEDAKPRIAQAHFATCDDEGSPEEVVEPLKLNAEQVEALDDMVARMEIASLGEGEARDAAASRRGMRRQEKREEEEEEARKLALLEAARTMGPQIEELNIIEADDEVEADALVKEGEHAVPWRDLVDLSSLVDGPRLKEREAALLQHPLARPGVVAPHAVNAIIDPLTRMRLHDYMAGEVPSLCFTHSRHDQDHYAREDKERRQRYTDLMRGRRRRSSVLEALGGSTESKEKSSGLLSPPPPPPAAAAAAAAATAVTAVDSGQAVVEGVTPTAPNVDVRERSRENARQRTYAKRRLQSTESKDSTLELLMEHQSISQVGCSTGSGKGSGRGGDKKEGETITTTTSRSRLRGRTATDPWRSYSIGLALEDKGSFQEAGQVFEELLHIRPSEPAFLLHTWICRQAVMEAELDEAHRMTVSTKRGDVSAAQAPMERRKQDLRLLEKCVDICVRKRKHDPILHATCLEAHLSLAQEYLETGQPQQAQRAAEHVLLIHCEGVLGVSQDEGRTLVVLGGGADHHHRHHHNPREEEGEGKYPSQQRRGQVLADSAEQQEALSVLAQALFAQESFAQAVAVMDRLDAMMRASAAADAAAISPTAAASACPTAVGRKQLLPPPSS